MLLMYALKTSRCFIDYTKIASDEVLISRHSDVAVNVRKILTICEKLWQLLVRYCQWQICALDVIVISRKSQFSFTPHLLFFGKNFHFRFHIPMLKLLLYVYFLCVSYCLVHEFGNSLYMYSGRYFDITILTKQEKILMISKILS